MSGDAAKEISTLLDSSVERVNEIVEKTRSRVSSLSTLARKKVKESSLVAHECGDALKEIVENTAEASNRTVEIRTAAREQSHGIQGITQATQQLDQVTQESAASAQHSSQAARHLYEQAAQMRSMVMAMSRAIYGQNGNPAKSRDPEIDEKLSSSVSGDDSDSSTKAA
jgi:methyl-accepting chemotaxis protein